VACQACVVTYFHSFPLRRLPVHSSWLNGIHPLVCPSRLWQISRALCWNCAAPAAPAVAPRVGSAWLVASASLPGS
jgi:hypothetical protein